MSTKKILQKPSASLPSRDLLLAQGYLTTPELERATAQSIFLWVIETEAPKVLADLSGDPWRAYKELRAELPELQDHLRYQQKYGFDAIPTALAPLDIVNEIDTADATLNPHLLPLQWELHQWQDRNGIRCEWMTRRAAMTLYVWYERDSPARKLLGQRWGEYMGHAEESPEIALQLPKFVYKPTEETDAEAMNRLEAEVKKYFATERERTKVLLTQTTGLANAKSLYLSEGADPFRHFRWTVQRYVFGMTFPAINRRYLLDGGPEGHTDDAVRHAVHGKAKLIGLPER